MADQDEVIRVCLNTARTEQITSVRTLRARVLSTHSHFKVSEVDEAVKVIGRSLSRYEAHDSSD